MDKDGVKTKIDKTTHEIDNEILSLLAKRCGITSIGLKNSKLATNNSDQVNERLQKIEKLASKHGLDPQMARNIFNIIYSNDINLQQSAPSATIKNRIATKQKIAYLGAKGSYSHFAAFSYCQDNNIDIADVNCHNFADIVDKVESGIADYGFLPIENTSSGSINEVFDLLQHTSLMIVGEKTIDVSHCLLVKPETKKQNITRVLAHSQPISQCSHYLSQTQFEIEYCASSADAMGKVQMSKENNIAAIGSSHGAKFFDLTSIEENLANQKINQTRFIIVAPKAVTVPLHIAAKTSLIIATTQHPGALVDALAVFKEHNLNITKLESRPIMGKPWQEMFYLDLEVNVTNTEMINALAELSKVTRFIKILGCYPHTTQR